jgi:hypothetical protein
LAAAYLRAAERGEPCDALAIALAEAVLRTMPVHLALAVLDGGPRVQARAIELAELVLAEALGADDADAHGAVS